MVPILAAVGETVRVRFMNEGIMYHPFHSHGYAQTVVARDGYSLGEPPTTPTRSPSARASVGREHRRRPARRCGRSTATSCPTSRGADGMFGMVNVLLVVPTAADVDAIVQALLA